MNVKVSDLPEVLACLNCHGRLLGSSMRELALLNESVFLNWKKCDSQFAIGDAGFLKMVMNIHSVWGRSHLLSYSEVRMLFRPNVLSLNGYFGFGRFRKSFLKLIAKLAMYYVEHLPSFVRQSFLNPYMLAEIRKSGKTL